MQYWFSKLSFIFFKSYFPVHILIPLYFQITKLSWLTIHKYLMVRTQRCPVPCCLFWQKKSWPSIPWQEPSARSQASWWHQDWTERRGILIDEEKTTHISGDFNIFLKKAPNSFLTKQLKNLDFDQLIQQPTHIEGGLIDHIYFCDNIKIFKAPHIHIYSTYYSDHDCLCTTLQISQL